jgi:hypothetical protein
MEDNNDGCNVSHALQPLTHYAPWPSINVPPRIPVYTLNALYLAPLAVWTYVKYGRPSKPSKDKEARSMVTTRATQKTGHMIWRIAPLWIIKWGTTTW